MVTVKCLYCDADNDPLGTGGYCDACGKKLPPAAAFRSRRGPGGALVAETDDDRGLSTPRSRAAEALFTIAVLQLVIAGLFLVLGPVFGPLLLTKLPEDSVPLLLLLAVPPVALFASLGVLARSWPVRAAVVALGAHFLWTVIGFFISLPMALVWLPASLLVLGLLLWPLIVGRGPQQGRAR